LADELGGSFAKVVLALVQDPEEFLVDCVHKAIEVRKDLPFNYFSASFKKTKPDSSEQSPLYCQGCLFHENGYRGKVLSLIARSN